MLYQLQKKDIGYDFKREQHTILERTPLSKIKDFYLADIISHNLGNIAKIDPKEMPKCDLITYSFPCQDLSCAGLGKGMNKSEHTRSGLLWEVERILEVLKRMNSLPTLLLMENVPEVIGRKNREDFALWYQRLEQFGYQSYYKIINSKDFGIPQERKRCFMISVLGNYRYEFPNYKKRCYTTISEVLENKVDKHYYISFRSLENAFKLKNDKSLLKDNPLKIENKVKPIFTYKSYDRAICINLWVNERRISQSERLFSFLGLAPTITAGFSANYLVPYHNLNIKHTGNKFYTYFRGSYQNKIESIKIEEVIYEGHITGLIEDTYLARRFTPKESLLIMGFTSTDYDEIKKAGVSESSIYKQAGNSIVVNVLEAIFKELLINEKG